MVSILELSVSFLLTEYRTQGNNMKIITTLLATLMVTQAMAIESLKYTVLEKDNKIEVRRYESYITASVTFDSEEEFEQQAFKTLADYIFGNNISMTSPVLTKGEKIGMTSPVLSGEVNSRWTMSFSMPKRYTLETLPTPNNDKIRIEEVQGNTIVAIKFSGFMSDYNFNRNEAKLKIWLDDNGYDYQDAVIKAGYNPPWTLPFLRRNEVLIPLI